MLGIPADELRGMSAAAITHPADRDGDRPMYEQLLAGTQRVRREKRYMRPDGSILWVAVTASLLRPGVSIGMVEDITERKELERIKDELLSVVGHELRTPLTSIRGYVELLEDDAHLTDEQRRFLGIVDRNAGRLLDLVSDLLFLAQVDAGQMTFDLQPVDLEAIVLECVESSLPTAGAKRIVLRAHTERLPEVEADSARLAQVLDNLVSNALKFTPEGGTVQVRTRAEGDSVVLEVEDTGIGIPAADQARLFERFFRSAVAEDQAIPGTGLGLAIVKAIVEAHSGEIAISSREGLGTTFRVALPLAARAERAA